MDNKIFPVFIDVGYGYLKAINGNNNIKVLRPSAYSVMPTGLNGAELGIETSYGDFLFGKSALDLSAMHNRPQNYEDCLSDAYIANVLMAISEMHKGNVVDCELVLSLPYEAMLYLANPLMIALTGEHKVRRLGGKWQTINITFPSNGWGVMPQNAAPVFASLDLKNINRDGEIWFAVANVGSQTFEMGTFGIDLDTYAIRPGGKAQQASEEKGMYTLADDIKPLLREATRGKKIRLDQQKIFKVLRSGVLSVGNQEIDVSEIIRPKKQEYLETVYNYCEQCWKEQRGWPIDDIYQLTVAGGGAYIVAPYLREMKYHNNIVVSDDPQFDVVVGSMKWHKLIGE